MTARQKAIDYLEEYSGVLWKQGQHDRSVDVGATAAVLAYESRVASLSHKCDVEVI